MTTQLDVQGRRTIMYWTNQSGGAVALGDVVISDAAHDESFTTTTTAALITAAVGVVIEANGIANGAQGRICIEGYVSQVNLSGSTTRGHFIKTHTVAKQAADAGTSRVVGVFAVTTTTSATPSATLFGMPDGSTGSAGSPGTPALTLSTTNSTGAASTLIATDATIAAFDATAPTTQAFGDAAAVGTAGTATRRDHKHAMPANPGFLQSAIATRTAGDLTTTSTSYVDLTGITVTLTTGARRCLVIFSANGKNSNAGQTARYDIDIDGSRQGQGYGLSWAANAGSAVGFTFLTAVLSAGSHTIKIVWSVDANTGTTYASTGVTPAFIEVLETGLTT